MKSVRKALDSGSYLVVSLMPPRLTFNWKDERVNFVVYMPVTPRIESHHNSVTSSRQNRRLAV